MRSILLTLAACIAAHQASATVIYSNNFEAETAGTTVAAWNNEAPSPWLVAADPTTALSGKVYYNAGGNTATNQNNVGVSFSYTVLGTTGDYIKTTFDYAYSGTPTTAAGPFNQAFNFFRFGMYTNNGTPTTYAGDKGYLGDLSYWDNTSTSGKLGDFSVREESNIFADTGGPLDYASVMLDNKDATTFGPPDPFTNGDILSINSVAKTALDNINTKHTAVLLVTKTTTGVSVALSQDGLTVASGNALNPYYTFDTLYFEGPSNGTGFAVDNLLIETNAVPEPTRLLLVAVGAVALITRRRRELV